MSNSKLVNYTKISPNRTSPRRNTIKKITIHHMAGNLTVEGCGSIFSASSTAASSSYGIGTAGRVGMYVEEKDRSWASSSPDNDHQAVTIEVANDVVGGNWHVSDVALAKLIDLCVDICQRNGIARLNYTGDKSGNLTMHKWFAATACPGPYLESKFPYIASEVNKRLSGGGATSVDTSSWQLYRVRKSWADSKSQIGAYKSLPSAKLLAEQNTGYKVFDSSGNVVYSSAGATAATTTKEEFEAVKTWKNGSTAEPVYADTACAVKIGSLNPWEECDCLGTVGGMYIVRYPVDGTSSYKVGLVVYDGGVT